MFLQDGQEMTHWKSRKNVKNRNELNDWKQDRRAVDGTASKGKFH